MGCMDDKKTERGGGCGREGGRNTDAVQSSGKADPGGEISVKEETEMKKPFFSVIVPEHNSAEFMRKGLESIIGQTFTDFELIVVCDACEDNTAEIAREYTDKVFEINMKRCGHARNKGLDEAQGEWILFMDDDDWFMDENVFQTLADNVGREDEDILAFGFMQKGIGYRMNSQQRLWTAVWNKAWRREFIQRIGARFPDWKHSDDDGFSQITHHRAKIAYMDRALYYYNFMREGSLTWQIEQGMLDGTIPKIEQ